MSAENGDDGNSYLPKIIGKTGFNLNLRFNGHEGFRRRLITRESREMEKTHK